MKSGNCKMKNAKGGRFNAEDAGIGSANCKVEIAK
jgi:hypothetical protein